VCEQSSRSGPNYGACWRLNYGDMATSCATRGFHFRCTYGCARAENLWLQWSSSSTGAQGDRALGSFHACPDAKGLPLRLCYLPDQPRRWHRLRLRRDVGQQHSVAQKIILGQVEQAGYEVGQGVRSGTGPVFELADQSGCSSRSYRAAASRSFIQATVTSISNRNTLRLRSNLSVTDPRLNVLMARLMLLQ